MDISIIVACANNDVIGAGNQLPWHLPEDLRHFKSLTMGKPIIMGRKTFESIGRALPGRISLVVTSQPEWQCEGVITCASLEDALLKAKKQLCPPETEIMVIGGAQIYRQALPLANRLYLTLVDIDVDGDAFFPEIDYSQWSRQESQHGVSEKGGVAYQFVTLMRG